MMKTWKVEIKEKGVDNPIHSSYSFPDDTVRTRKDMIEFWGLHNDDVEWYNLELVENNG